MSDDSEARFDRRDVLKTIGAGAAGTAAAAGLSGTALTDSSSNHFHNPVYEPLFPDPSVVYDNGTYYAYCSNMDRDTESNEKLIQVIKSSDLVNWSYVGEAMSSYPDWKSNGHLWAPNVVYYNNKYYLYYSYSVWGSNEDPGIGVATASNPDDTFTDQGKLFRESDVGLTNCIDADFHEVGGTPYMVWGSFNGIHGIELTSDGLDYKSGTDFHLAGDAREAASMFKANGYWYLIYSTGFCCDGPMDSTYGLEVGRSTSFTGPYTNQNGDDLTTLNSHHSGVSILEGNDRFKAPGHNTVIQDTQGQWWILYHAYDVQDPGYHDNTWRRVLMVDQMKFDSNDWPVIAGDGTPSWQSRMPEAGDTQIISDGTYFVENVNSGSAMEVNAGIENDKANVQQYTYNGYATQQWYVEYIGNGEYRFMNENSWEALTVEDGKTGNGANLNQYTWRDLPSQRWEIVQNSDGTYRIRNVNSGRVADVLNADTADGTNIIQYDWLGNDNQKWNFKAP
ncbi:MAG: family 43 glycosylhydrolase [Haloarculaceae archaeon]